MTMASTQSGAPAGTPSGHAETHSVVVEREFAHPPEKVWRALTQGPLIKEWMLDNDFQPVVGHKFKFQSTPVPGWNGIIDSEVQVIEPGKRLTYTWKTMGMESLVMWTLAPKGANTVVRMEHAGFKSTSDAAYKGATYGWQKFIGNLDRVVAGL
jgi:uncharacterized protein YndB with AHSA1/START domain